MCLRKYLKLLIIGIMLLLLLMMQFASISKAKEVTVLAEIYGSVTCPACAKTKESLEKCTSLNETKFYVIRRAEEGFNETYLDFFIYVYNRLELGKSYYIPLTLIWINDDLAYVIVGLVTCNKIEELVRNFNGTPMVIVHDEMEQINASVKRDIVEKHEVLITKQIPLAKRQSLLTPSELFFISSLALLDSLNPCFFSILLILYLIAISIDRKIGYFIIPLLIGSYIGYVALGLGIIIALSEFRIILYILSVVLGAYMVYEGLTFKKCKYYEFTTKLSSYVIKYRKYAPILGFMIGVFLALTILPCSAAPYIASFNILASKVLILKILGILYYNIIFILPAIILIVILKKLPEKAFSNIEIIGGFLSIIIGLFYLIQYFETFEI